VSTPETRAADTLPGELLIAVYLDTNVLLDLLATVEDGFSLMERVTSEESRRQSSERSGSGEFGIPSVFHFFKLGLTGKAAKAAAEGATATTEAEKTHTYGSLLHRLRRYLADEGLIAESFSADAIEVGHFIEFPGVLRPNPFTDSFRRLQRMLGFADVAMAFQGKPASNPQPGKGNRGGAAARPGSSELQRQVKAMGDFITTLTSDVEREGTSTVLVEHQGSPYKAVVTLFDDYLRDRSMAEVLNREFRVLGKVARHLPTGSNESVDLLASSGVAGFPSEILGQLTSSIGEMAGQTGMQMSRPATTIDPPVIEIVPIAIYL
jgi:hypothetical protein